jgi:2-aminoadipate transaminase
LPLVDLDRFDFLYATRVKGMKSAVTRDLMATLSRPGIISLAGGFPDTKAFGEEAFREISQHIAPDAAQALQYGPTAGLEPIKDVIVEVMGAEGTPARQEDVFVTTGAQQGLDLVAKVFLDEGDAVLCEGPTYAGALNAFAAYRPKIAHAPMDRAGIIPVAARETLMRARKQGIHVKFIYTVPNFQNPAGVTMVAERRREMLELAREFDLIIVEDNPYGMLRFEGEPLPTLAALEQEDGDVDRVVYLGTFSKIFAPGVRLGWVHAQPGILHKINVGKQGADLCSSNLSQMMISSYFRNADWRAYVKRLTGMYRERRDAMLDALAEFMPKEVHWTHPEGGLFVWATLPSYLDATAMLPRAIAKNVAYVPGEGFYGGSPGTGKNHMRLNFSFVEPDKIRRGVEILAETIRERMELRSDMERGSRQGRKSGKRPGAVPSGTEG